MSVGVESVPVRISATGTFVDGDLRVPPDARGLVIFAHGSGSSRFSRRNRRVAVALEDAGCATLLLDLLTTDEEAVDQRTGQYRFDVELLGARVVAAIDWAAGEPTLRHLPVCCFGASTGAAAALLAAVDRPSRVRAVVSRGGRPDLAGDLLPSVKAPTLLIVGGLDDDVLELNEQALQQLKAPAHLQIVPGATHLFEEPGALTAVASLAASWCREYLFTPPATE